MALNKYIIGDLIEQTSLTNSSLFYSEKDVKGMTIDKRVIPTKAKIAKADLKNFLVIQPNEFIYNPRTHGKRIGLGFNNTNENFIISWNNIGFRIKSDKRDVISPTYLYMYLNRLEWDRNACFMSWGSSTEVFSWKEFTKMKIELPPLEIQKKYVTIYESLIKNQKTYEDRFDNLKICCEAYIEDLRKKTKCQEIGNYIEQTKELNTNKNVVKMVGLFADTFKEPRAKGKKSDISTCQIIRKGSICYPPPHFGNIGTIGLYNNEEPAILSPMYVTIKSKNNQKLLPEYLMLWFNRDEFKRYAGFHSDGSIRDTFDYGELSRFKIPIPDIETQKAITNIYSALIKSKKINDMLKKQIQTICPILIYGSQMEARKN